MLLVDQGLAAPDDWRQNGHLAGWVAQVDRSSPQFGVLDAIRTRDHNLCRLERFFFGPWQN
jgi:hypothetical protein